MPFSMKTIAIYFFILPAIFYAGLVTHFTYDFSSFVHLWKAYNALALSMLEGGLDVTFEAIGRESTYYNGKVYFYFGYFPVLIRLIAAPFIDLNTAVLSNISVWLMTTMSAATMQYALILYSRPKGTSDAWDFISKTKLVMLSLIVWFGSAQYIIAHKGDIYHEPYAAMLMLSSLFIVLVYRDLIWDYESRNYRLVLYASLAAMSVHTRPTIAISLYMAVLVLIIMKTVDVANDSKSAGKIINLRFYLSEFIRQSYLPLFILFLGGGLLLLFNYLRFDDFFSMAKGEYGYMRAGEGFSRRVCGTYATGSGRFEVGRIIPNAFYYLFGGRDFHAQVINYLGLGYVRIELRRIYFILLWSSQLIIFLIVLGRIIKAAVVERVTKNTLNLFLMTTFMISALMMLSYTTISVRYVADLWLPLGFSLLLFSSGWVSIVDSRTNYLWYLLPVSVVTNIAYSTHAYIEYEKWDLSSTKNGTVHEKIYSL